MKEWLLQLEKDVRPRTTNKTRAHTQQKGNQERARRRRARCLLTLNLKRRRFFYLAKSEYYIHHQKKKLPDSYFQVFISCYLHHTQAYNARVEWEMRDEWKAILLHVCCVHGVYTRIYIQHNNARAAEGKGKAHIHQRESSRKSRQRRNQIKLDSARSER